MFCIKCEPANEHFWIIFRIRWNFPYGKSSKWNGYEVLIRFKTTIMRGNLRLLPYLILFIWNTIAESKWFTRRKHQLTFLQRMQKKKNSKPKWKQSGKNAWHWKPTHIDYIVQFSLRFQYYNSTLVRYITRNFVQPALVCLRLRIVFRLKFNWNVTWNWNW